MKCLVSRGRYLRLFNIWTASSEFGTYRLCEQRRFRRAVSPEPSLLAHRSSESRGTFRKKARSLAPLTGWACAVKMCHDGMLEDTNSLDGAHLYYAIIRCQKVGKFLYWHLLCSLLSVPKIWIENSIILANKNLQNYLMFPLFPEDQISITLCFSDKLLFKNVTLQISNFTSVS